MQALILAAGLGRRLGPLTEHSTKCMVELNGRRLIDYALDALASADIERLVLVVGHGADEVCAHVGQSWQGMPVTYVRNEAYAQTNNIYSLLLAADQLRQDDTLVLESDVVFEPAVLAECLAFPADNVAVVAKYEPWMDGTMTVLDDTGAVQRFVPKAEFSWADRGAYYKTVNIYKLSRAFLADRFVPLLETYIKLAGRGGYYEEVLRALVFMDGPALAAMPIGDHRWYEIDDANDLDVASQLFSAGSQQLPQLKERHGGYWRFPRLRDFAYLVNPGFPTPALAQEIAQRTPDLMRRYPSALAVQRLLAAGLLGCRAEQALVGNGASELIAAVLAELGPGRLATPVPTFEEYRQPPAGLELLDFEAATVDAAAFLAFCRERRASVAALVNPGNPTGELVPRAGVAELAEGLRAIDCRLMLDESFIDFAGDGQEHSLLRALEEHPNVVLLRSISKSYGVPGLRLGVAACADADLMARVAARLPIWNINALAEYFLQVAGRHREAYLASCAAVAAERGRFSRQLEERTCLRPWPSSANYLLCDVGGGWTATELTACLLGQFSILVKDCSAKRGLEGQQCLRIAVNAPADNDVLVDSLAALGVR